MKKKSREPISYPLCAHRSNGGTLYDIGCSESMFISGKVKSDGECMARKLDHVFCERCPKYHGCEKPLRAEHENSTISKLYEYETLLREQLLTLEAMRFEFIRRAVRTRKALNL